MGGSLAGALKRVLTAFAAHDAALGYVQSMNFLAAFLLLAGVAEEDAFWCLVVLVEDVVPGYFCEGMVAAKVCECVYVCVCVCLLVAPTGCHRCHRCHLASASTHACLLASTPPEVPLGVLPAHAECSAEHRARGPSTSPLSPHVHRSAVMPAVALCLLSSTVVR